MINNETDTYDTNLCTKSWLSRFKKKTQYKICLASLPPFLHFFKLLVTLLRTINIFELRLEADRKYRQSHCVRECTKQCLRTSIESISSRKERRTTLVPGKFLHARLKYPRSSFMPPRTELELFNNSEDCNLVWPSYLLKHSYEFQVCCCNVRYKK